MFDRDDKAHSPKARANCVLIQAGQDMTLEVRTIPQDLELIKLVVDDEDWQRGVTQRLSVKLMNNGDATAVLLSWRLIVEKTAIITNCNHPQGRLIKADLVYDIDLDETDPQFDEEDSIPPNEFRTIAISVGRRTGGPEFTVYRCRLCLAFETGGILETGPFFLKLLGPTVHYSMMTRSITPNAWGKCMAANIRRLDRIGYDYRPLISPQSTRYIIEVAPELFR